MLKKGTKLYSILNFKCARCQEGDLFFDRNPFHLNKLFGMYDKCPVCGQKYEPEPGFWFGAMYVSYALNVALWVSLFVAIYTFVWIDLFIFLGIGIAVNLIMVPVLLRLSRSIWMNFFIQYDPTASGGKDEEQEPKEASGS